MKPLSTDEQCDAQTRTGTRCQNRGTVTILVNVSRADCVTVTHLRLVCKAHDTFVEFHQDAPDNRMETRRTA